MNDDEMMARMQLYIIQKINLIFEESKTKGEAQK
jgi:hypothetical protein